MENKLFTVTYNIVTKGINVCLSPMETVKDHNTLHFDVYSELLMHVYADDEKQALNIARIDIQTQLYNLSKDIDRAVEGKLSEKFYIFRYNIANNNIELCRETEISMSAHPKNINRVENVAATTLEVVVLAHNKRGAKNKALDLISEYFSDIAKRTAERKKVVEEFDDED